VFELAFGVIALQRLDSVSTPEHGQVFGLLAVIWLAHTSNLLCVEQHVLPEIKHGSMLAWNLTRAYKILFRFLSDRNLPDQKDFSGKETLGSQKHTIDICGFSSSRLASIKEGPGSPQIRSKYHKLPGHPTRRNYLRDTKAGSGEDI